MPDIFIHRIPPHQLTLIALSIYHFDLSHLIGIVDMIFIDRGQHYLLVDEKRISLRCVIYLIYAILCHKGMFIYCDHLLHWKKALDDMVGLCLMIILHDWIYLFAANHDVLASTYAEQTLYHILITLLFKKRNLVQLVNSHHLIAVHRCIHSHYYWVIANSMQTVY